MRGGVASALAVLAGAGGCGGDGSPSDREPPTIVSVRPEDGGGIAQIQDILIEFSEPIDRDSLTAESIYLEGIPTMAFIAGVEATLRSDVPLPSERVVNLVITTEVTDLAGNPLASEYRASFTVSDRVLWPVERWESVPLGPSPPPPPQVAIDEGGNAIVLYLPATDLLARRISGQRGAMWGGPEAVETGASPALAPALLVSAPGDGFAVFWQDGQLKWNHTRAEGAAWDGAEVLSASCDPGGSPPETRLATNPLGDVFAVWICSGDGTVHSRAWPQASSTWSEEVQLSLSGSGLNHDPRVSVHPGGQAIAAWATEANELRVAHFDGATWLAPESVLSAALEFPSEFDVAALADGDAVLAWVGDGGFDPALYAAYYDAGGGGWMATTFMDALITAASPSMTTNGTDAFVLAWEGGTLYGARFDGATATWDPFLLANMGSGSVPPFPMNQAGEVLLGISDMGVAASRYRPSLRTWTIVPAASEVSVSRLSSALSDNGDGVVAALCQDGALIYCVSLFR